MKTLTAITLASPYALILVGYGFVSSTLAATLGTERYTIKLQTSSGNSQKLGTITEFVTDKSLRQFYDYRNEKYNGEDLGFKSDHSHLFFVRSTSTNELGLFSLNGSPDNEHTSLIRMDYKITGGIFTIRAVDDAIPGRRPEVTPDPSDPLRFMHGVYGWRPNFNDGVALAIDDQNSNDNNGDQPWEITIDYLDLFSRFNNGGGRWDDFQSLHTVFFLSSDSDQNITFDQSNGFQDGTSFIITPSEAENIPEPSNIKGLIWLGFLGGGWLFLKRKR